VPLYDNLCEACRLVKETYQQISDDSRPSCPKCGVVMRRLFARNSLILGDAQSRRHFKPSDYGKAGR
jgi:putative FmdB family regulatory protein